MASLYLQFQLTVECSALLTHLYQYFGVLLGCSATGFPAYAGDASQYSVHRYMNLGPKSIGYFVQEVGLAAASFGVTADDVKIVAAALHKFFGYRCSPATTIVPAQGAQLQSVCTSGKCAIDPAANCSAYPTTDGTGVTPFVANASLADGLGRNMSSSGVSSSSKTKTKTSSTTVVAAGTSASDVSALTTSTTQSSDSTASASASGTLSTMPVASTGAANMLTAGLALLAGGAAAAVL